jgi:uncharacterized protein
MTHGELQDALVRMNLTVDAAEAHGWLCGALCAHKDYDARQWLSDLAADAGVEAVEPAPDDALRGLPEQTLEALRSPEFEFAPLLPPEHAPLRDRVSALAAWGGGFLYGVGTGVSNQAIEKAGDVAEYLRDLADIARVELEPDRNTDAGEGDFAELFEFVRAGAQLTFDELEGARTRATG